MDTMTEILHEIHRIQVLSQIRRYEGDGAREGCTDMLAVRLDMSDDRAADLVEELVDEGLVLPPMSAADGFRLSAAGEGLLEWVSRKERRTSDLDRRTPRRSPSDVAPSRDRE